MSPRPRWPGHDYSSPGAYFVTICADQKGMLFAPPEVANIISWAWDEIPSHFPTVAVDAFVVMPNHVHGILVIRDGAGSAVVAQHAGQLRQNRSSLSDIVRSFKSAVTRELRMQALHGEDRVWQPNYYDRVIRDEAELNRIREYIAHNPIAWQHDSENPARQANDVYERAWGWLEKFSASENCL